MSGSVGDINASDLSEAAFIFAAASDLSVTGTASRDMLTGYSGDDVLDGLGASDIYRGAGGNDIFVLGSSDFDRVVDFELGNDKLDVSAWNIGAFDDLKLVDRLGPRVVIMDGNGNMADVRSADETFSRCRSDRRQLHLWLTGERKPGSTRGCALRDWRPMGHWSHETHRRDCDDARPRLPPAG